MGRGRKPGIGGERGSSEPAARSALPLQTGQRIARQEVSACRSKAGPEPDRIALRRLQTRIFLDLGRISRVLERRITELFAARGLADVTPQQANVLMVLFEARSPLTARSLATSMAVSEQTMGRFVRALEGEGWVTRTPDPEDRRAIQVRLTPKAYRTLPEFIAVSNAMLDQAFGGFDPEAIDRISRTSRRMLANLGEGP
jgi:DNA-binding MarR family transcriptional regulator